MKEITHLQDGLEAISGNIMARPKRFERSTPAFGGQYSIQLSYGRKGGEHNGFFLGRLPAALACG